ncbi:SagB/ThcOx family dehydrogenase [Pseudomonas sp. RIT-PI-S]|uniref:SagB/ThcOx family dehydrogenase n=1 Tax=Pseudomonas sp. RIT-PI-S TaxID=3035295 RepID=UPI0021D900B6|nr:SagB/ThcOx family dehydrogenase [Pseudomonas sp. RIT-PI-S]
MNINTDFILLSKDNAIIAWNYVEHTQYQLSTSYSLRYVELMCKPQMYDPHNPIDKDLADYGLVKDFSSCTRDWGWDILSEIFHYGTKDLDTSNCPADEEAWAEAYIAHCEEILVKTNQKPPTTSILELEKIPLPTSPMPIITLEDAFLLRKTCRDFHAMPVNLQQLSVVLKATLGFRQAENNQNIPLEFSIRRYSPSGGGMNATNGYVYINSVGELKRGFYKYDPNDHSIILIKSTGRDLGSITNGQHFSDTAAFAILLTSRLNRLWWKYSHSRAYRMALIELGHHSQTALLSIAATGLKSWITGALEDTIIETELGIAGTHEQVFFCIAAGHGTDSPISKALLQRLNGNENNSV